MFSSEPHSYPWPTSKHLRIHAMRVSGAEFWIYFEVLFKALILLVNLLYTTIWAYAPLP